MMMKQITILILLASFTYSCAQDKNPTNQKHTHKVVVEDLQNPWGFTFLPDGSILITEKKGELIHFKNGKKIDISGLPNIEVLGQGGFMDVELHPDYDNNGWIYFSFSSPTGDGSGSNTAIIRAKMKNNTLVDKELLYKAEPNSNRGQHFWSRLAFDKNGYLYFSIGDRGDRDTNPQDITRDCGKIYRLHDDGSIPKDNPFVNSTRARKAIYSYGHRNPQGMVLHPSTGELWTHEHGPRGGDEINIIKSGRNYGWPVISYGINYSGTEFTGITEKEGMEQPLHYWDPSIAPSGMAFITSDVYPGWKGRLLVGSLRFQYLNLCTIKDGKVVDQQRLIDGLGRVRSIEQGPDGHIYVGVENVGIVKIIPDK